MESDICCSLMSASYLIFLPELNEKLKSCSSGRQPSRMKDKYSHGANTICLECEEGVRPMHRCIRQLAGSTIFVIKTPLGAG